MMTGSTMAPDLRGELRQAIRAADCASAKFQDGGAAIGELDALCASRDAALIANDAVVYAANRIIIAEADRLLEQSEDLRAALQYIATLPVDAEGSPNAAHDRIVAFLKAPPADGEYENHPAVATWRATRDRLAIAHDADAALPE